MNHCLPEGPSAGGKSWALESEIPDLPLISCLTAGRRLH